MYKPKRTPSRFYQKIDRRLFKLPHDESVPYLLSRSGQVDAKKLDFALRVAIRYDQLMYETAQRIKATEERLVMEKERIDVVKRISRIAEQRRHEKNKEWLMRYEKKEAQLTKQLDRLDRKLEKNALKLGDYLTPDDGHKA